MRILVTGATGVVGRRVSPLLIGAGHRVTALGRSVEKLAALARQGAATSHGDLFDPNGLRAAAAGCDAVVNLATHMLPSTMRMLLPGAWSENDRIRRAGSANLVNAAIAAGVRWFIQESFAPAYPDRSIIPGARILLALSLKSITPLRERRGRRTGPRRAASPGSDDQRLIFSIRMAYRRLSPERWQSNTEIRRVRKGGLHERSQVQDRETLLSHRLRPRLRDAGGRA